jgi:hypothetical protein
MRPVYVSLVFASLVRPDWGLSHFMEFLYTSLVNWYLYVFNNIFN